MRDLTAAVVDAVHMAGFVEIEVSAKHVHLTQEDVEVLFGKGAKLEPKRPLSQPGQFLSEQRVTLIGPKKSMERVAVLGPVRQCHTGRTLKERLCGPWSHSTGKGIRRHRRFRLDHDSGSMRDTGSEGRSDHRPQPHSWSQKQIL